LIRIYLSLFKFGTLHMMLHFRNDCCCDEPV